MTLAELPTALSAPSPDGSEGWSFVRTCAGQTLPAWSLRLHPDGLDLTPADDGDPES
jgi:hypothetical protein